MDFITVDKRTKEGPKPQHVVEELILPAAADVVREVLDQSTADKLKTIPLSNDIISRRVEEMFNEMKKHHSSYQGKRSLCITEGPIHSHWKPCDFVFVK